jgi:hypothetical protein
MRTETLREIHRDPTAPRSLRAHAIEELRDRGDEPRFCFISGKLIPWKLGDVECPGCGGSGEGACDAPDGSCGQCNGFGVIDSEAS